MMCRPSPARGRLVRAHERDFRTNQVAEARAGRAEWPLTPPCVLLGVPTGKVAGEVVLPGNPSPGRQRWGARSALGGGWLFGRLAPRPGFTPHGPIVRPLRPRRPPGEV